MEETHESHPLMKTVLSHTDAKEHRGRFISALIAEAVAQEWKEKGLKFPGHDYRYRLVLGKIKDENLRLYFANIASAYNPV